MFSAHLYSPSKTEDLLAVNLIKGQVSRYGRRSYQLPMGADGLRVGLHGPFLNDQLIVDLSGLQSSGVVITSGLERSYPNIRAQKYNLHWSNT